MRETHYIYRGTGVAQVKVVVSIMNSPYFCKGRGRGAIGL